MATPKKIQLTVNDTGIVKNKSQTNEAASKVSELLQKNHEQHHVFFNDRGFHNHIVHHLLTIYGLGAPASALERGYAENASYQRPPVTEEDNVAGDLNSPQTFLKCMGNENYYHPFLIFFQQEMEDKGWEKVVNEYLFAGDKRADQMLGRIFAGFLHPIIHLGFGIEFNQPAIIAEALAQAAVHRGWTGDFLLATEQAAKAHPPSAPKTLPDILDAIQADKKLSTAARFSDDDKIRDGIFPRAKDEMIKHATQWVVTPENLEEKTAEMIHTVTYFTIAAQRPPKQVKMDFFLMHCLNCSIFFPTFNALPSISTENKVRMLQFKGYIDLLIYASRGAPPLLVEEISNYVPVKLEKGDAEWPGIFERLFEIEDDGHASKLGRAVRHAELANRKWEENNANWVKIKGFMWEKCGNMVIDSVEDTGDRWVRNAGFEEAWEGYSDRPRKDNI